MGTNFAKEFKLYESLFFNQKLEEAAKVDNASFFAVLCWNCTDESFCVDTLTMNEDEANQAYDKAIVKYKDNLTADDSLMLVRVFDMKIYNELKAFAGKDFIKDTRVNNLLDSILDDGTCDTLKYYEGDDDSVVTSVSINDYRVVLADYESDDFDINVEFGMQDPEEPDVINYEYLLKPGQTRGDLVVFLSRDCGFTSIYVHDERPASASDIKRLAQDTFPVTGTGDDYIDYGDID